MKNSSIFLFVFICSTVSVFCQNQCNDFRNFCWGTSFSKVKVTEKATFLNNNLNDALEYRERLGGSDCSLIYTFNDNDKLISGSYIFTKKYSSSQLYLQDYYKFKSLLILKYGKEIEEKEDWIDKNNSSDTNKENYGEFIAQGKLNITTYWTTPTTNIKITLITKDKKPSIQIHYTTKNLSELENKIELEKIISKL
ncbi:MAG: hypothetical protein WCJ62_07285 [Flavobacterium sp.]